MKLSASHDPDCQRLALQTLELLAIENPAMIAEQDDLLQLLLELPNITVDMKVYILAGKILLYFSEDPEVGKDQNQVFLISIYQEDDVKETVV